MERKDATDWSPSPSQDLDNPQTWTYMKKSYHVGVLIAISFLCPFGSSVYTPGTDEITTEFGVSKEVALLPFVLYLLGLAFGPVLASPLSETFGRRIVYVLALPVFAAFTLGAGFCHDITSLSVCRFFAGFSASPSLSLGSGTIADIFVVRERAVPMAIFVSAVQLGPVIGPLVGGFTSETVGWRWSQWVILFGIAVVIPAAIGMSETYKIAILEARAKRLGVPGPPKPKRTASEGIKYFVTKTVFRPMQMLFTEPIVAFFDIYTAFTFGLLNAFFTAFPWVFENMYGFNTSMTGLTYLSQAVGTAVGLGMITWVHKSRWSRYHDQIEAEKNSSGFTPEMRLIIAMVGAPLLPISLFWFGWTSQCKVHWISPVIAEGFFSMGNLLIFTCALLFLQDCYGAQFGASAASSNTFARYFAGFAFPLFAVQMYEGLGSGWASSLLGFVAVALMPIPFAFARYGPRLRQRSKYHPED